MRFIKPILVTAVLVLHAPQALAQGIGWFDYNLNARLIGDVPPGVLQPGVGRFSVGGRTLFVDVFVGSTIPESGRIYDPKAGGSGLTVLQFSAPVPSQTTIVTTNFPPQAPCWSFTEQHELEPYQISDLCAGAYFVEVAFSGGQSMSGQIVLAPEPSSLAILGLAATACYTRHRFRLRAPHQARHRTEEDEQGPETGYCGQEGPSLGPRINGLREGRPHGPT